jgi:hypothetical protein
LFLLLTMGKSYLAYSKAWLLSALLVSLLSGRSLLIDARRNHDDASRRNHHDSSSSINLPPELSSENCARQAPTPIRWIHFPKAGTSFIQTVYSHACPCIPLKDIYVPSVSECQQHHDGEEAAVATAGCEKGIYTLDTALYEKYPPERWCPSLILPVKGHSPVSLSKDKGHLVAIFRDPIGRLISMFNFVVTTNWYLLPSTGAPSNLLPTAEQGKKLSLKEFVALGNWTYGCQTKMVLGKKCSQDFLITNELMKLAGNIVIHDFLFAGLVEQWELSIKLFHCKLGGTLFPNELRNVRPGRPPSQSPGVVHSTKGGFSHDIRGISDPFDSVLYEQVSARFQRDVRDCGL